MSGRKRQGYVWSELSAEEIAAQLKRTSSNFNGLAVSGFLDTHQWSLLQSRAGIVLEGGHSAAQYRRAALGHTCIAVRYIRIEKRDLPDHINTAHQLRSWLYRAGMPDSAAGDIVCGDYAALVVEPDVEPIELGLNGAIEMEWHPPEVQLERTTAASSRVDAIVAALFHVSRGEAQKAVRYGFIFHNFTQVGKRSRALAQGDQVVFRTKGRVELVKTELNQRSGRLWVSFRRYPG